MEKFNEHKELPWREYDKGIAKATEYGVDIISPMVYAGSDRKFIVEACNNYYRLKGQNERLLSALNAISSELYDDDDKLRHLRSIIDQMKSTAFEAIKSCQP